MLSIFQLHIVAAQVSIIQSVVLNVEFSMIACHSRSEPTTAK
jgi:hypothetical protein